MFLIIANVKKKKNSTKILVTTLKVASKHLSLLLHKCIEHVFLKHSPILKAWLLQHFLNPSWSIWNTDMISICNYCNYEYVWTDFYHDISTTSFCLPFVFISVLLFCLLSSWQSSLLFIFPFLPLIKNLYPVSSYY